MLKGIYSFRSLIFICPLLIFSFSSFAQSPSKVEQLEQIQVSGSQNSDSAPVNSVSSEQIRQQVTTNLGDLLNTELGMSSTSFGNNASRPIIRGMSSYRVPIMQNGMGAGDLSALSNDHSVTIDPIFSQRIDILRGSDALRYGAGSPSGLIQIENTRIAQEIVSSPYTEFQSQYNLQNQGLTTGILTEGAAGNWSLHFDGVKRNSNDYQRPDGQRQEYSSQGLTDLGIGATYHADNSYTGFSYGEYKNFYGIPSVEGSFIDMQQKRFDLVHVVQNPFDGFHQIDLKYAYIDYSHTELSTEKIPQTGFTNIMHQIRVEAYHNPIDLWQGSMGAQFSSGKLSALDLTTPNVAAAIIPQTQLNNFALFLTEHASIEKMDYRLGLRFDHVSLTPSTNIPYTDNPNFSEPNSGLNAPNLNSYQTGLISTSGSAFYNYAHAYATGLTLQMIQRAPSIDELYSYGNHDASASFDIGNSNLTKETAYQIEWGWKKTQGMIQSQAMVYYNKTNNYIYGQFLSVTDQNSNNPVRLFSQANATITGYETEVQFNPKGTGLSARVFSDGTRGTFEDSTNLPLQPAYRLGGHISYELGPWSSRLSLIHALGQDRLASFETYATPGYNKLDFRVSRKFNLGQVQGNAYFVANNLLNDTIRYSTTIEGIRINAPQAGRSFLLGLKLSY